MAKKSLGKASSPAKVKGIATPFKGAIFSKGKR